MRCLGRQAGEQSLHLSRQLGGPAAPDNPLLQRPPQRAPLPLCTVTPLGCQALCILLLQKLCLAGPARLAVPAAAALAGLAGAAPPAARTLAAALLGLTGVGRVAELGCIQALGVPAGVESREEGAR